jgi:hypothetical protein
MREMFATGSDTSGNFDYEKFVRIMVGKSSS